MGSTISKGYAFGATETVTNTLLGNLVDDATFVKMTDADGDTQIQTEESSDEDIIRFDIAGTEVLVIGDGTTEEMFKLTNTGTHDTLDITASGIIATGKHALIVTGTGVTVAGNSALVKFVQDNAAASEPALEVDHDGTGNSVEITAAQASGTGAALFINQTSTTGSGIHLNTVSPYYGITINHVTNALTSSRQVVAISSTAANTNADSAIVKLVQDNASSSEPGLEIKQDGTGAALEIVGSATVQIKGSGNETLSAAGAWTDRTSTYDDKEDIEELVMSGYIDKLKALKLFSYKKKCEVYGNKEDVEESGKKVKKYPKKIKNNNARIHKGYILDDPSTPEELISRNQSGEIDGMSGTQNANFLLIAVKELISRVEALESI